MFYCIIKHVYITEYVVNLHCFSVEFTCIHVPKIVTFIPKLEISHFPSEFTAMMMIVAPNSLVRQEVAQGGEEEETGGRRKAGSTGTPTLGAEFLQPSNSDHQIENIFIFNSRLSRKKYTLHSNLT